MLTSLFPLFYITGDFHRFLHQGRTRIGGAIFKTRNGESGNGNGERGTGNGESLKRGIFKSGNL